MSSLILWYFTVLILGWAAFPLVYRVFPHLYDRGYGLVKPAGLLLFGYSYWILVTFRLLPNTWSGASTVILLVLLAGLFSAVKIGRITLQDWIHSNFQVILTTEIVFTVLFVFFAFIRAANPEIVGTEKPMEMAFINAILRSPSFPPNDPWLSGYAISYYYFGYVMVAGLIRLTGVIPGVGFNLSVALWFAMAGIGSLSTVYNIISGLTKDEDVKKKPGVPWKKVGWALFGPLLLIFTGNWQGFLEVLHSAGVFWTNTANGLQSSFWKWLDIQELTLPPSLPLGWIPERVSGIWWWRASRVLQDYDLVGNSKEIIDEFPFFSLYLGDLHPHILAMPFVFLAVGLGLEFYYLTSSGKSYRTGLIHWFFTIFTGSKTEKIPKSELIPPFLFWATALILGGLAFLNTWDFPIYVGLVCAAIVLGRYLSAGWDRTRLVEFFESGLSFGLAGIGLFFPFYMGFSSQAGGFLPSLAFFTRGAHFWVMFGVLLIPILLGLLLTPRKLGKIFEFQKGIKYSLLVVLGLWGAMILLGMGFAILPGLLAGIGGRLEAMAASAAGQFFNLQGSALLRDVLLDTTIKRLFSPGAWITIGFLLTLVWAGVLGLKNNRKTDAEILDSSEQDIQISEKSGTYPFLLLLIVIGIGLTLFPEFFYLRDQFGWRMNTIFKFYYQTWILWSMAAAVSFYMIWKTIHGAAKWVAGILLAISLLAGLVYPYFGLYFRFQNTRQNNITLDGNAYIGYGNPDEDAAIKFLQVAPDGIVAEAIGGSYSGYGRISTQTGLVTVLGWPGHESQWRGGAKEIGSREDDIKRLYQSKDWSETLTIIQKYQIRYIYLGWLESNLYNINESKFKTNLLPVFQNNSVVIYEVSDRLLMSETGN